MTKTIALAILAVGAAQAADPITVRSAAIGPGGMIAQRNSAYGADQSLQVAWTAAPKAKSYAVVLDDPDAPGPGPFVHWLMWNIPAGRTHLDEGAAAPAGAVLGRNGHGGIGYWGPHPPSGTHHYHLQVLALDAALALPAGADRGQFNRASRGHVIASGEVVGLFSAPR
ncbi:MAG TPA: YbhB/YbcL family Raf kinase inhibitor-like protein [Caulobacteraceae bacterium]|jgi:Raf kinase inhibitor-like YbhB/YbcL family protein